MQKKIKILSILLTVLFLAVSCNSPHNPKQPLFQKWQDKSYSDSQYVITGLSFDSLYQGNKSYSFDIKYIDWNKSYTEGIIYGQYTANDDTSVIGKWYAVSFKDLTETTIKICGASKQIETDPDTRFGIFDFSAESLEEAKTKFTEANGYFSYYSDCIAVK